MSAQTALFDYPELAQVRRDDPLPSRVAAASRTAKAEQWKAILKRLGDGPISADTAGRVTCSHRHIASARLGVMMRRGLVEKAGVHDEPDEHGRVRPVLRYRLTEAGTRELHLMFGGAA